MQKFLADVNPDDIILTVNRRLGTYLQKSYAEMQMQLGHKAWQGLNILPLQVWIEQIWQSLSPNQNIVLNEFQEQLLWEQCIEESTSSGELLAISPTASLVKETWKLMQDWLLEISEIQQAGTTDTHIFLEWVQDFQNKCQSHQTISRPEIIPLVTKALTSSPAHFSLSKRIFFIGFDDFSPAMQQLQTQLKINTNVLNIQLEYSENTVINRVCLATKQDEIREMARWAYSLLESSPQAKIGCIVPNLSERRAEVLQIFTESKGSSLLPFNISAGQYLTEFPIIVAALKILALNLGIVRFEDISCLILSPFLGGSEIEFGKRARFDCALRSSGEKKHFLHHLVNNNSLASCPILAEGLKKFCSLIVQKNEQKNLEEWALLFTAQLNALGWPGGRSLNSTEFQLVERFKKLFSELMCQDFLYPALSLNKALSLLQQLANKTIFQPKSEETPIQVLGILEASGIGFDYLWVSGLDNESWPPACTPNPFLPFDLQRKKNMPHASPDRELDFSKNVTARLLKNAPIIFFSHAEQENDRHLSASPLILNYPITNLSLDTYLSIEKQIYNTKKMESYIDDQGPPIQTNNVSGGSGLFKAQAACPFQAFAKFRLFAKPLDTLQLGLAPHEKGILIHDVLAHFWNQVKNHQALCSFSEDELVSMVEKLINHSLTNLKHKKPFTLKTNLFALEKKRVLKLILNWLELEKTRQAFAVICSEKNEATQVGNLQFQIKIDRIDQLTDGSHVIIDYKTGKATIKDWSTERPHEPQLPLYATLFNESLSAVLFGQLRSNDISFKGLVSRENIVPGGVIVNLEKLIEEWQEIMMKLAKDFSDGKAQVNPKGPETCQFCQLHSFCRI